jgi:hypothetical protein
LFAINQAERALSLHIFKNVFNMVIRFPATESEFEAYYALRWKILREPWNQPPGSEKDEFEGEAVHLAAWDDYGKIIGVGRLHRVVGNRPERTGRLGRVLPA